MRSEKARFVAKFGGEPQLVPVATGSRDTKGGTHAIAIFVHDKNPITQLSMSQLREIFAHDGRITTSQCDGCLLGKLWAFAARLTAPR